MNNLEIALSQLELAHAYSDQLLADVPDELWFSMPHEGVTHIGWQVGHIAIAKYRLGVAFLREVKPDDEQWFTPNLLTLFRAKTTPQADASLYPPIATLREAKTRIHAQVIAELQTRDPATLAEPALVEHRIVKTKGDALFWCARHEMVHAGQIGLLKRLLGMSPQW